MNRNWYGRKHCNHNLSSTLTYGYKDQGKTINSLVIIASLCTIWTQNFPITHCQARSHSVSYYHKRTIFGASLMTARYLLKCVCGILQSEVSGKHEQKTLCQRGTKHLLANPTSEALHLKHDIIYHRYKLIRIGNFTLLCKMYKMTKISTYSPPENTSHTFFTRREHIKMLHTIKKKKKNTDLLGFSLNQL